jgi:hypothetical protein
MKSPFKRRFGSRSPFNSQDGNGLSIAGVPLSFLASAQPYTVNGSNKISVVDSKSAGGTYGIALTISDGDIAFSGTTGLTGDTTGTDGTLNVTGSLANINTALDGLVISTATEGNRTIAITFSHSATSRTTSRTISADITENVAPVLSSATDTATGGTTANINVTTDEGAGWLYYVVTLTSNAPSAAQVKAGQNHLGAAAVTSGSQVVSSSGAQGPIAITGLSSETTYYAHFMQEDEWGNQSTVASGNGMTTSDVTGPVLSSATGTATSDATANISVSSNEGSGTLWWAVTTSATPPSAAAIKAGTGAADYGNQAVSGTGSQGTISVDTLSQTTAYYAHFYQEDASSNASNITSSGSFTTEASGGDDFNAVLRTDNSYSLRTDGSRIIRYMSEVFNGLLRTDGSYLLRTDGSRRLRVS